MITNLLATVVTTLVTNTTERFPQQFEATGCPDGMLGCLVAHGNMVNVTNPKEKWIDTIITKQTVFTFSIGSITNSSVVTNWTQHFVKIEGWQREKMTQ